MSSQRGLVQRIERKLEVSVGDAFARVFGGSIVPQEVEAMLRREAAEGIRPVAGDRLLAPNEYIITLGRHDYQKVGADPDLTSDAFAKHLSRYIGEQGWQTYGDVVIRFEQSANLHTGQFRTRGAVNPDVEHRPHAGDRDPVAVGAQRHSLQATLISCALRRTQYLQQAAAALQQELSGQQFALVATPAYTCCGSLAT